ncbi:hypothetical protein GCM10010402_42190 [Actinomadura luteofluorescens]
MRERPEYAVYAAERSRLLRNGLSAVPRLGAGGRPAADGAGQVFDCESAESLGIVWDQCVEGGTSRIEIAVLPAEAGAGCTAPAPPRWRRRAWDRPGSGRWRYSPVEFRGAAGQRAATPPPPPTLDIFCYAN